MLIMADFISIAHKGQGRTEEERSEQKGEKERWGGRRTHNVIKDNANELKLNGKKNGN